MPKGLLLVGFDFTNAHADEFHDWYDLEHVPERQRVPGFGLCERWISVANPKQAVASYEMDNVEVLDSPAYQAIGGDNLSVWSKRVTAMCTRLIRFEGTQCNPGNQASPTGAGGLLVNAMEIAPEHRADFDAWYDQEHIPALSAVPGVLAARRYKGRPGGGTGCHYSLALYHLQNAEVAMTDAWKKAASSPWTDRVRPTFQNHVRILSSAYKRG